MKKTPLIAALLLIHCCGCKSSSPLLSWMGKDHQENLAPQSTDGSLSEAKLPPPTNASPRTTTASVNSLDEHLKLGDAELKSGRYAEARAHFQTVLAEQPQNLEANHRMGVLCDKIGEYATSEQHYRIALINDPKNPSILSDFGYSYWLQGRYPDSERLLLQARQVDPQYKTAIANLGMLYGTTGREQEALALFRQLGDESAAQDMMKQVAAMTPPSAAPAVQGASMSPASLSSHQDQPAIEQSLADSQNVNEPTRKILDLMEEARREQAIREQELINAASATHQRNPPAFVQDRPQSSHPQTAQTVGVDPFHGPRHPSVEQPRIPDEMLSQAFASIDQQGRRTPQDGPINLGPGNPSANVTPQPHVSPFGAPLSGSPQFYPSGANGQPTASAQPNPAGFPGNPQQRVAVYPGNDQWPQAQPSANAYGSQQSGSNLYGVMPQFDSSRISQPQPPMTQPPTAYESAPAAAEPVSSAIITYGNPHRNPNPNGTEYPAQSFAPIGSPSHSLASAAGVSASPVGATPSAGVRQASGSMIQQTASNTTGQQNMGHPPVEHAYHQQQPGAQPPIDLLGASVQPNSVPPAPANAVPASPGSQWPLIPSGTADPNDPYELARREAAMMGLGAGPGQMFPYVQQTNRAVPGTSSLLNGGQYPAPQRQLPNGMNPADLNPSFASPQATNLTPGQNYQGQLLPQVAAPIATPSQLGAPASATFQQFQQTGYEGQSATAYTQLYEDVRQQSAQQLNGLINQTYGQPVQTPPAGIAALPSQTYHAPQNPALSQYNTPQMSANPSTGTASLPTDIAPPSRWTPPQLTAPTTQAARPTEYHAPQSYSSHELGSSGTDASIVVPEQYPAAVDNGYQTNSNSRKSQPYPSEGQPSGNLPIIVPGHR